ncbi:MAG: gamma-glutamylcyclotransferase family protein [Methylococcaceae bacterium]
MNSEYIFVYGTLRRTTKSGMYQLLAKYAEFVDNATCIGKLFRVGYYLGMVPSDNFRDIVYGEVYCLQHTDIVLPLLDQYEEFGLEFPEPNEYSRQQQNVFLRNGNSITAWIYIYNHPTEGLERIESGDFLKVQRIDSVAPPSL